MLDVRATGNLQSREFLEEQQSSGLIPRWYVVCTMARHEKQVATQLLGRGIDCFLPLYEEVHRWKDRRKTVSLPLFPGYVFVRIPLMERLRVQVLPSVLRFVGFGGPPVALDDPDVERLRNGLSALRAEPHPFLKAGQPVRVKTGPLAGAEGILERHRDNFRVVLSMDLIVQSARLDLAARIRAGSVSSSTR